VLDQTPRGRQSAAVSSVHVRWSEAIQDGTFAVEDVTVTPPSGVPLAAASLQVVRLAADEYEVRFPPQTAEGPYMLALGPDVSDLAGNRMILPYEAEWFIDTSGPRVIGMSPPGQFSDVLAEFDVTFDEPLASASFQPEDVVLSDPHDQRVAVQQVMWLGGTTYRVSLAPVRVPGTYTLVIGPQLTDLANHLMNQDGDGINGEPSDAFTSQLVLRLPDAVVSAADAPAYGIAGQSITTSWTVTNQGDTAVMHDWTDTVYLSTDAIWDAGDLLLHTEPVTGKTPLNAGQSYPISRTFAIPHTAPTGNLYLIYRTDANDDQAENDETNNTRTRAIEIKPIAPDLVIANAAERDAGYRGYDVWNATGAQQTKSQGVVGGTTATYWLQVQNRTAVAERYTITSSAGAFGWTVAFFDAATGGNDVTAKALGTGWRTDPIPADGSQVFRLELTPEAGLSIGSAAMPAIRAQADDNARFDVVQAEAVVAREILTVFQNDFETTAGAEWSNTATATTPVGERSFLGPFSNQSDRQLGAGRPAAALARDGCL